MHNTKIINYINITIYATLGVFIGLTFGLYINYRSHPGLYVIQSAPWYTNAVIPGIVDAVIITFCILVKIVLKIHKTNN